MSFPQIHSADELAALVEQAGFLPFFKNEIKGFSIEECCAAELWFSDDVDGPWEWKGPVARGGNCVYGKFFDNKAGFVVAHTALGSSSNSVCIRMDFHHTLHGNYLSVEGVHYPCDFAPGLSFS